MTWHKNSIAMCLLKNDFLRWPTAAGKSLWYSRLQLRWFPRQGLRYTSGWPPGVSTILMYTAKRGRGTILVAIESMSTDSFFSSGSPTYSLKRNMKAIKIYVNLRFALRKHTHFFCRFRLLAVLSGFYTGLWYSLGWEHLVFHHILLHVFHCFFFFFFFFF